ncbi:MAG: prephenate dehydratase [Nitrososphaerales archaeon]
MNHGRLELKAETKVAFQGELGAYSQSAVYSFFGRDSVKEVMPLPTLQRVFSELCSDPEMNPSKPNFAVVPIENSTAGSVGETFDLLVSKDVKIIGETAVPIQHAFVIHRNADLKGIKKVISHPQALAQCREYLDAHGWQQTAVYDTAGAVKMIRDQNLLDTGAIASELSSEIYGLKLAERSVEDDHSNRTRFIVVVSAPESSDLLEPSGNDKTSVIFSTKHSPGSLVRALSALSFRGINLSRIESRPIKSKPWEYYFYVDFDGHLKEERCKQAVEDLQTQTLELKILGSYKRAV